MRVSMLPVGDVRWLEREAARAQKVIENALDETSKAIEADYHVVTQTWEHKPKWNITRPNWWTREIYTEDEIMGYVSEGTKPHEIRPRNAPRLAFQSGYNAKTMPRIIASRPGGSYGPTVYSMGVHHPGNEGRDYPETIGKKWDNQWPVQLDRALAADLFT